MDNNPAALAVIPWCLLLLAVVWLVCAVAVTISQLERPARNANVTDDERKNHDR